MKYIFQIIVLFILLIPKSCFPQPDNNTREILDILSEERIPNLNKEIDLSVNDIPLKEFIRILANNTGINIVVDNNANWKVNNNFSKVKAKDVIEYLCDEYGLSIGSNGSIIKLDIISKDQENLIINYDANSKKIDIDSKNISLKKFFKEITVKTGINFTFSPGINDVSINCYIKDSDFKDALKKICFENKLILKDEENIYIIEENLDSGTNLIFDKKKLKGKTTLILTNNHELYTINSEDEPIENVTSEISANSNYRFIYLSQIGLKVNLNFANQELEDILDLIFKGTDYTYKIQDDKIFLGSRKDNILKSYEFYKFKNRRVDSISYEIPQQVKNNVTIEEFVELNSLILWGDRDNLNDFKSFLKQLDQSIPLVLIDVIVLDVSKVYTIETGFEAGLSSEATSTLGLINPGLDLALSSSSINNVLNSIGLTNLGKVTPNFYVQLKALETDGIVEIRSTPQLSTLNGHPAYLSIGKVEYYRDESSNYYGSISSQLSTQYQYKPVEAKLKIEIKPFVTGNGEITLDVFYSQSDFSDRISEYAPPGINSRDFKSQIRVKNQEMVLLGGLEENTVEDDRSGWPILSRIPILKWIFSSKTKSTTKKHLNIFIKPTVIY